MKVSAQKILKIISLSLASILLLITLAAALCINVVFTPEKLTPIIRQAINENIQGKLELEKAELTFFSSFPRFGVKLNNGQLISKTFRDSLWLRKDTLLAFKEATFIVKPIDFLLCRRANIHLLSVDSAQIYAYKARNGKANWLLQKPDTIQNNPKDTPSSIAIHEFDINCIALKNTTITFDDRETGVFGNLWDTNLTVKAKMKEGYSLLAVDFQNKNLLFWQNGQLMANRIASHLKTEIEWDSKQRKLSLHDALVNINGIALDMKGDIRRNTEEKALDVNLEYGLHAPSMTTLLRLIPESILKKKDVSAKGEVIVGGSIKGLYGKNKLPLTTLEVKIKNASAQYSQMPYGVDDLNASLSGQLDFTKKKDSFLNLEIFRFKGGNTDILARIKANHLLTDPNIALHTRSVIDMTTLAQIFPLQEGVAIEGKLNADLDVNCRWSSIKNEDWGRIRSKGIISMEQLMVQDSSRHFQFSGDAILSFNSNERLEACAEIRNLQLQSSVVESSMENLTSNIHTSIPKDSMQIANLECLTTMRKLKIKTDSTEIFCGKTQATTQLHPAKACSKRPEADLKLDADTLFFRINSTQLGIDKAGINVSAEKMNDSLWIPKGIIGFDRLTSSTSACALPIEVHKTAVTVGNQTVHLQNANIQIGQSDLKATGAVYDLYGAMKFQKTLRAQLELTSNMVNCNQLIQSFSSPKDSLISEVNDTTTALKLFVIPKNIDFKLKTHFKQVLYERTIFEDVQGTIDIRNQAIHLQNLDMKGLGADIHTTLVYQAQEANNGYAGFNFQLNKIDISKLVDFLPALDTIVPMLRSFEGTVDFNAAAETQLDSCLNIQIPTLRSAIHVKGDSLVLMDGETFAEISKKFFFKNKKRNRIDHISANISVKDGNVTVYPFEIALDRYRAAIGGTQGLDMNFNYHISILKSPVPFKLGLNITGNLDDMKFRLGKAKYKDAVTPVEIHRIDSTIVNMGEQITRDFKRIMRK